MSSENRAVDRLRPTPLLVIALVMQTAAIVLYAVNASHLRIGVIWGWLPTVVVAGLAAIAARQAAAAAEAGSAAARLWRTVTVVAFLTGLGTAGDARQSVLHPERMIQQDHDALSSACYALALGVLCWTLLRMPGRRTGRPQRSTRLLLDALTLGITVGVFAWYFMSRAIHAGDGGRVTIPMIMLVTIGLIVALAAVKL
ncbi:MAG TPA: hypothetical protein VGB74_03230, partial [Actinoplanes sp.]